LNHNGTGVVSGRRAVVTPLLLWALTLLLWLPWLGNQPLRDWDEGLVATVARSTWQQVVQGQLPLDGLIAYKWDAAYLNKPPGLHWLIGGAVHNLGEADWVVRLVPCLLSSLAVPLIYWLRCGLNPTPATPDARRQRDRRALMAALILMTLLPMARHGRLAMLDGTLVSCSLLLWSGWITSRTTPWHALLAGLGGSGVLLLKPPALLGFLLIALAISLWERRPWRTPALGWFGLGLLPGIGWHGLHLHQRGADALVMWGGQGLGRITEVVGENQGAWVMPITEVLEGGWPWLLLLPTGLAWAWRHRQQSSGRWELGLLIGSAALVLPLRTQLPWYSHLLWAPIALLCGEGLAQLLQTGKPRWLSWGFQLLGVLSLVLAGLASLFASTNQLPIAALLLAGLGLLIGGAGLHGASLRSRHRGLVAVLVGWGLALLMLWQSQLWLWELNESWDPRPIAGQIRQLPDDAVVVLKGPTRPSLGWYAGRELRRPSDTDSDASANEHWRVSRQQEPDCDKVGAAQEGDWALWHCPATT
jgi:4-amino-4-deoxy-L-arabinose transferase-like glycosyltransferase